MLTRIITGIIAFILFVGILLLGEIPFTVGMGIIIMFMLYEAYGAVTKNCALKASGYITGVIILTSAIFSKVGFGVAVSIIVAMLFLVILHGKADFKEVFATHFMTMYVTLMMSYIPRLYSEMGIAVMAVIFIIAYILYAEVLRENTYLSRTIEVQENQKVIDTGLYGIVRHPMYSVTLLLFLSMPLVLGSVYSFIIFLVYPFIIAKRIKHEEEFLEKELNGYREYKQKVKYRLIPFIW